MSIIIRLQNLPWSANSLDIRKFFDGLSIPEGGVHIVGGEKGDAFIAFLTDEDARLGMQRDGSKIKDIKIKLLLSSRAEMQKVIELARSGYLINSNQSTPRRSKSPVSSKDIDRKRSPDKGRSRDKDKNGNSSSKKFSRKRDSRSRSRSPRRFSNRDREKDRDKDKDRDKEKDRDKDRDRKDKERDRESSRRTGDKTLKRDDRRRSDDTKPKDENSRSSIENGDSVSRPPPASSTFPPQQTPALTSDLGLVGSTLNFGSLFPIVKPADMLQSVVQGMDRMIDPSFAGLNSVNRFGLDSPRLSLDSVGLGLDPRGLGVDSSRLDPSRLGLDPGRMPGDMNRMEAARIDAARMEAARMEAARMDGGRMNFDMGVPRLDNRDRPGDKRNPPVWQENAPIGMLMAPNTGGLGTDGYRDLDLVLGNSRHSQESMRMDNFDSPYGKNRFGDPDDDRLGPRRMMNNDPNMDPMSNMRPSRFSDINEADPRRARVESCSVEIRGMPANGNYKDVREFFRGLPIAPDGIKLINNELGEKTGQAFVRFTNERDAKMAVRKHNMIMINKRVEIARCPERVFDESVDAFLPKVAGPSGRSLPPHRLPPCKEDLVVVLKGLPYTCREDEVIRFFEGLNVLDILIEFEPGTKKSTGTAFVEFGTQKDLMMAMSMDNRQIGPRTVHISVGSKEMISLASLNNIGTSQKEQTPNTQTTNSEKQPKDTSATTWCLIMRNLPPAITNLEITNFFSEFRIVPSAIHIMLGGDGNPNGDAFVELSSPRDLDISIRKNGAFIGRLPVNIQPIPYDRMLEILGLPRPPNKTETDSKKERLSLMDTPRGDRRPLMGKPQENEVNSKMNDISTPVPIRDIPLPIRHSTGTDRDGPGPIRDSPGSVHDSPGPIRDGPAQIRDAGSGSKRESPGLREGPPKMRGFAGPMRDNQMRDGNENMDMMPNRFQDERAMMMMERGGRGSMMGDSRMRMVDDPRMRMMENRQSMDRFGRDSMDDSMDGPMPMDLDFPHDDMGSMHFQGGMHPRGPYFGGGPQRFPNRMMGPGAGPMGPMNGPYPQMGGPMMGGPRMDNPNFGSDNMFGKPGCVVGLQNIPFRATIDEVIQFFDGYGLTPDDIMRRYDQFGRSTGDARISFRTPDDAQRAVNEFSGKNIHNRTIHMFMI